MIALNFDKWNTSSGFLFIKKRVYIKGYKWTPFVTMSIRYKGMQFWDNLIWGLGLIKNSK